MNFYKRRAVLKSANYLELTPIRLHREEVDSNGNVTILIPKFTNRFAQKFIVPRLKAEFIKLKLDELGSAVWQSIDGEKKVAQIRNELHTRFGAKIHPVEERLTKFLTGLYEQRLISFQEINK